LWGCFFTSLNNARENKNETSLTPEKLQSLQPVLSQRDESITLLARNDHASADRLLNLDLTFRKALGHPQQLRCEAMALNVTRGLPGDDIWMKA
jgi:hypothetical protein